MAGWVYGPNILRIRKSKPKDARGRWSKKRVADLADIDERTYASIERGGDTQTSKLKQIAAALGVDVHEFFTPLPQIQEGEGQSDDTKEGFPIVSEGVINASALGGSSDGPHSVPRVDPAATIRALESTVAVMGAAITELAATAKALRARRPTRKTGKPAHRSRAGRG